MAGRRHTISVISSHRPSQAVDPQASRFARQGNLAESVGRSATAHALPYRPTGDTGRSADFRAGFNAFVKSRFRVWKCVDSLPPGGGSSIWLGHEGSDPMLKKLGHRWVAVPVALVAAAGFATQSG